MIVKVRQINTGEFLTVQGVLLAIQSDLSSGLEGANDKRAIQEFSINDIVYIISMNSAFEIIEIKPESLESGMINARSELISKIPNEVTFKNDPNLGTKINEFLNKEGLF